MTAYYLAVDVGGTKTDLSIFSVKNGNYHATITQTLKTSNYSSLEQLLVHFISTHNPTIAGGILAVAGPVINDQVSLSSTNLPWAIDRSQLINELNIPRLLLINDLEALATAIPILKANDLYTINRGSLTKNETIAIIAPGTGLGEAFSVWDGTKYQPHVSEGGLVNFGPRTKIEIDLLRYISKKKRMVSYESVCSGLGIPFIYEFLKENTPLKEPDWLTGLLESAEDRTPVIFNAALQNERNCEIALDTVKLFISILGSETGNLVLKTMARGGVYLGGSLARIIIPFIDNDLFMQSFKDKGMMEQMMLEVPVHVITNPDSVVLGAAEYLFRNISRIN